MGGIATLGGLGGLAAFIRARGQNRTDFVAQLNSGAQALITAYENRVTKLEAKIEVLQKHSDDQDEQLRKQGEELSYRKAQSEQNDRAIVELKGTVQQLQTQNAQQAVQIAQLTDEKARLINRVTIAESKYTFIENENNILRTENERLRAALPMRTEAHRDLSAKDDV